MCTVNLCAMCFLTFIILVTRTAISVKFNVEAFTAVTHVTTKLRLKVSFVCDTYGRYVYKCGQNQKPKTQNAYTSKWV